MRMTGTGFHKHQSICSISKSILMLLLSLTSSYLTNSYNEYTFNCSGLSFSYWIGQSMTFHSVNRSTLSFFFVPIHRFMHCTSPERSSCCSFSFICHKHHTLSTLYIIKKSIRLLDRWEWWYYLLKFDFDYLIGFVFLLLYLHFDSHFYTHICESPSSPKVPASCYAKQNNSTVLNPNYLNKHVHTSLILVHHNCGSLLQKINAFGIPSSKDTVCSYKLSVPANKTS